MASRDSNDPFPEQGSLYTHSNAEDVSPPRGLPFPVAGVGASAGGLEAMQQFLKALPADTGIAIVFIQHLDPSHESMITRILAESSRIPVTTIEQDMVPEPDHVYVMPPNVEVVLNGGKFKLRKREPGLSLPINTFFHSLAEEQGGRAIGIVLSGNGMDGSDGIRAIKAECGLAFAQDEFSAQYTSMPRNAAIADVIDFVLPPGEIARELSRIACHPYIVPPKPQLPNQESLPDDDTSLKNVLAHLLTVTAVDFTHYKQTTVRRRISRRMIVRRQNTVRDYARYLEQHPEELRELYRDLLISVTAFFRDPAAFQSLGEQLERLLAASPRKEILRIWVSGCATGEEAYSVAICAAEVLDRMKLHCSLQLFGTDLNEASLDTARTGLYPDTIESSVTPERLQRFFYKTDGGYQISKSVRESCIFARQDLTRDPPFSQMDVITCRNVLIYLDAVLQKKVLSVFHYSLNSHGLLMMGSAETVGTFSDLFEIADGEHRIYTRKDLSVRPAMDFGPAAGTSDLNSFTRPSEVMNPHELQRRVDRIVQRKYSPAGVVVNAGLEIIQFRGQTNPYLDPAPGHASLNLLKMVHESLVIPLRRAVRYATEQNTIVREACVLVRPGERIPLEIEVTPIVGTGANDVFFLVIFDDRTLPDAEAAPYTWQPEADVTDIGAQLEQTQRDLLDLREYVRQLSDNHQSQLEEIQAANEEIRSANEELQSTNQDLSTTKEELQSVNEELKTVHEELESRNRQLTSLNDDLKNLLDTVHVPIIIVDKDLRLRRFTAPAEKLLEISSAEIGRPVGHIRGAIEIPQLESRVREVIQTLRVQQHEVEDREGKWHMVMIRPYKTLDQRIDGAVIGFFDIDALKQNLRASEEARSSAEALIETVRQPLVVLDDGFRVRRATMAFYDTFQVSPEETIGRLLFDLGSGQWNIPRLRQIVAEALFGNVPFQDFEIEHEFPHIGKRTMRLNGRRIDPQDQRSRTILLAIEDITELKQQAESRYRRLFETAMDGLMVVDADSGSVLDVNRRTSEMTGYGREELVGKPIWECRPFRDVDLRSLSSMEEKSAASYREIVLSRPGGDVQVEVTATRYMTGSRMVVQFNLRDITERNRAAEELKRSLREKDLLLREIHHRVKNNLQMISSLLGLQASRTPDDMALREVLEQARARIRTIGNIHDLLYRSGNLGRIDLTEFVRQLAAEMQSLNIVDIRVHNPPQPVFMPIDQAIPCSLIMNELVTNAVKHAFPGSRRGAVEVALRVLPGAICIVQVKDDGVGMPDGDTGPKPAVGLELVDILVQQLNGQMELHSDSNGTRYEIRFPIRG